MYGPFLFDAGCWRTELVHRAGRTTSERGGCQTCPMLAYLNLRPVLFYTFLVHYAHSVTELRALSLVLCTTKAKWLKCGSATCALIARYRPHWTSLQARPRSQTKELITTTIQSFGCCILGTDNTKHVDTQYHILI